MGRRGGRGGRGGGEGREREDQYGGGFGSQDREERPAFGSAKSNTGGGSAGSQTRHKGGDLAFQRHVPKFLQQYAHMLGRGGQQGGNNEDGQDEDKPVVVGGGAAGGKREHPGGEEEEEEEEGQGGAGRLDDDIEEGALRRAMAENPALAKEFETQLNKRVTTVVSHASGGLQLDQSKAVQEKERGNKAFAAKDYAAAIASFTTCIELDPQCEVYFSNRSAAHAAQGDWEAAAQDARQAVKLAPKWAKAHTRLGAAFSGLQLHSDAKEAYERALQLEPDNQATQKALERSTVMELQSVKDRKHVFFNKRAKLSAADERGMRPEQKRQGKAAGAEGTVPAMPKVDDSAPYHGRAAKKGALSFEEADEGGGS
ncbi:hypothetical protein QJQ45_027388 [Haematococcus lacustris]|nr:hypothetical protein QJQ45_027388 [Haematococcus lacustris]